MPKKKLSLRINAERGGTVEKSLSSPDISEVGKGISKSNTENYLDEKSKEANRKGVNKERKQSWFRRFLKKFDRKKRKSEPVVSSESFSAVEKSSSCIFYTPPPTEFLNAATNRSDETDSSHQNRVQGPTITTTSNQESVTKPEVKRGNSLVQGGPLSPLFMKELKETLSVNSKDDGIKVESDSPEYGNMCNLKYPASRRRKSRALSNDSETFKQQFSEINELYEHTWEFQKLDSTQPPEYDQPCDLSAASGIDPQPIKPLLAAFPKPRPPANRKPSTRRGSKPEVILRNRSIEESQEAVIVNRRSNAELEMVIQKLGEIPAPEDSPFTPTPKRRTKFFTSPPSSPTKDLKIDEVFEAKTEIFANGKILSQKSGLEENEHKNIKSQEESGKKQQAEDNDLAHKAGIVSPIPLKKKSIVKRTNSFPCIKVSLKHVDDAKLVIVKAADEPLTNQIVSENSDTETRQESNRTAEQVFIRSNTLPPRYNWDSAKLVHHKAESGTIVVVKNTKELFENNISDGVTHLAILLQSDNRPLTQDSSTQTSLRHSEIVQRAELLQYENYSGEMHNKFSHEQIIEMSKSGRNGQNTPPNTPEQDTENDESDTFENDLPGHSKVASTSQSRMVTTKRTVANNASVITSDENYKDGRVSIQPETITTKLKHHNNDLGVNSNVAITPTLVEVKSDFGFHLNLLSKDEIIKDTTDAEHFKHKFTEVPSNKINSRKEKNTKPPAKPQRLNKKPEIPQKPKLQEVFPEEFFIHRTRILESNEFTLEPNRNRLSSEVNQSISKHLDELEKDKEDSPKKKRRSQSII